MGKYYWLVVTADEYELPLAVADTSRELAKMYGTTKTNVENCIRRRNAGQVNGYKYVKVLNDEN